jgi:putative membrane protein
MMWGYGFGWGWLMMAFGTVLWVALLVVLVWALIRWLSSKTSSPTPTMTHMPPSGPSALEILQQRYARGEIDTATFEQMRERLQAADPRRSQYENPPTTGSR